MNMQRNLTMESGFGHFDCGHRLVPLMFLVITVAQSLGIGSRWTCHLLCLIWGLVLLCVGENGGDLHGNEGKNTLLRFSAFRWFLRCVTRCIISHYRLLDGCRF